MAASRLVIADDHTLFRNGLRAVLERHADIVVVGEAEDAASAVRLTREAQPDVILLDLRLPDRSGVEAVGEILAERPAVKIIALTMYDDEETIAAALQAGVQGYLLKRQRADELIQAVQAVAAGGAVLNPAVAARVWGQYRRLADGQVDTAGPSFSEQEHAALRLLAAGQNNRQIAENLHLSRPATEDLLANVYRKLGVHTRPQAVAAAFGRGLIGQDNRPTS
jgi:DNA-binding NarL/FixJ family response regulator